MWFFRVYLCSQLALWASLLLSEKGGVYFRLWMLVPAVALEVGGVFAYRYCQVSRQWVGTAQLVTSNLILAVSFRSWPLGVLLILSGAASNTLVIAANGMRMPYAGDESLTSNSFYRPISSATRLPWLADIFSGGNGSLHSVGDMAIVLGTLLFVGQLWRGSF